jgi:hypothetical protein
MQRLTVTRQVLNPPSFSDQYQCWAASAENVRHNMAHRHCYISILIQHYGHVDSYGEASA